ncbi:uracil-DNA glycosylase [Hydrogenobaculum sp.]
MNSAYIYETIGFGKVYIDKKLSKSIKNNVENVENKSQETLENHTSTTSELLQNLKAFYETCKDCKKCQLSEQRTQVVFGDGNPDSKVLFVGEAPGADEDVEGKPFVGKAGKLLTQELERVGLLRQRDYYITNVVKCRPPGNRTPEEQEMITCSYILKEEVKLIKPQLVIALGKTAAVGLSGVKQISPTKVRGGFISANLKSPILVPGTKIFVTYHPSYLLRNPNELKNFREDIMKIKTLIESLR